MKTQTDRVLGSLTSFAVAHPGLLFSMAYAFWAIVGVLYLHFYYLRFDIPILKLLEVSDVIVAGFQDIRITYAVIGSILVNFSILALGSLAERLKAKYNNWEGKPYRKILIAIFYVPKNLSWIYLPLTLGLVMYFYMFLNFVIDDIYQEVMTVDSPKVLIIQNDLPLTTYCNQQVSDKWYLLGSSTKFIFVYSTECHESLALPFESVSILNIAPEFKEKRKSDFDKLKNTEAVQNNF